MKKIFVLFCLAACILWVQSDSEVSPEQGNHGVLDTVVEQLKAMQRTLEAEKERLAQKHSDNASSMRVRKGEQGDTGLRGLPGFPGVKGQKGQKGHQGSVGDPGFNGEPGMMGLSGPPGPMGPSGRR